MYIHINSSGQFQLYNKFFNCIAYLSQTLTFRKRFENNKTSYIHKIGINFFELKLHTKV